jgi:hypothetical protein
MNSDDSDTVFDVYDINWSSVPQKEKKEIIDQHIRYIKLSRSVVGATSSYIANIRSLFLMLFLVMLLAIIDVDNKSIILSILFLQFLKTIITRVFEVNLTRLLDDAKIETMMHITNTLKKLKNG